MQCDRELMRPRETVLKWHAHALSVIRAQPLCAKGHERTNSQRPRLPCQNARSQRSATLHASRYVVNSRFKSDWAKQAGPECYTEKAPNAWHRRGTPNTGNTYHQPKRPSTGTTHRPRTRHYLKGIPGVRKHRTNQHSSRARLNHSNHPPSSPTPNRVITRSSQPTQPLRSTGGLSRTTTQNAPRLSGDTPGGAHSQEWLMDSQGRTASLWRGEGGGGEGGGGHIVCRRLFTRAHACEKSLPCHRPVVHLELMHDTR